MRAALIAGIPVASAGVTVSRFCASGLEAIASAARRIVLDGVPAAVAGGVESISLVQPHVQRELTRNAWLDANLPAIAMPMIGGTTSWVGPLLGAILLGSLQQLATVTISSAVSLLIVGLLLVFFVIIAPNGLIGLWHQFFGRKSSADIETPEIPEAPKPAVKTP